MKLLTGWPKEVLPILFDLISSVSEQKEIHEFYIGRSIDPAQRFAAHNCDDIFPIYYSDSIDNAIIVESTLIESYYNHPKCSNDAPHGGGRTIEEYGNYVYLAIWY